MNIPEWLQEPKPQRIVSPENPGWIIQEDSTDEYRLMYVQRILEALEFKGTIHQIRELVNDPKWDDKV